jgi:hypothetical protein
MARATREKVGTDFLQKALRRQRNIARLRFRIDASCFGVSNGVRQSVLTEQVGLKAANEIRVSGVRAKSNLRGRAGRVS